MWIFGFGSLMTDGWEVTFGCIGPELAELLVTVAFSTNYQSRIGELTISRARR